MPEVAFINGEFMPLAQAVVPIEDRGFQFADGVYEVVATYGGRPYALEPHLQRLERSLRELRLPLDPRAYGLERVMAEGVTRSGFADALIYVQVTRGVAPRHHEFPDAAVPPTVVMTVKELRRLPAQLYDTGVRVITHPDLRWKRCDIKSIGLLANVLAKQHAVEEGAFEALLVDAHGHVTEGASTSAFCVRSGVICATPDGPHILPSITRAILLELAQEMRIPVRQSFCTLDEYRQADEVFLAGTTTEALAVVQIDSGVIGEGHPGPLTRRIREAFLGTVR